MTETPEPDDATRIRRRIRDPMRPTNLQLLPPRA